MSPDMPDQGAINNPFTDDQVFTVTFHPVMWPWIVEALAAHGCDMHAVPWQTDPTIPQYLAAISDEATATWAARRSVEG